MAGALMLEEHLQRAPESPMKSKIKIETCFEEERSWAPAGAQAHPVYYFLLIFLFIFG
jgi:hypothetical protein